MVLRPTFWLPFGTGQYLTDEDTADTSPGGFYVVSDNGSFGLGKADLEPRTISTKTIEQETGGSRIFRTLTGNPIDWNQKNGWYVQLQQGDSSEGGERVVTRPDLLRDVLFFNTMIPTGQVCSAGGYGWLMSVDVHTGLPPSDFAVFDGNGDGVIDGADLGLVGEMVTQGMPNKSGFLKTKGGGSARHITSTTDGSAVNRLTYVGSGTLGGRLSWEEITPN